MYNFYIVQLKELSYLFAWLFYFKIQFKKLYEDIKEETFRKKVYLDNKLKIARHNKLYESGEETYALEMNHFGDLVSIVKINIIHHIMNVVNFKTF